MRQNPTIVVEEPAVPQDPIDQVLRSIRNLVLSYDHDHHSI